MGEPYMKLNDYVSDLRHVPVTSLVIGVVISCFFLIYPMLVNAVVQTLPESEKMLATQRACRFAYLVSGWMVVMGTCAMFLMAHHLSVGIAGFQQSAVLQFIAHLYMQSFVVLMIALGLAVMCFPYYVQHTILARFHANQCTKCRYDLGDADTCPECGWKRPSFADTPESPSDIDIDC